MKILALDLATATGVAVGDSSDRPFCSTERFSDAGRHEGLRFLACMNAIKKLVNQHRPDVIAIEEVLISTYDKSSNSPARIKAALGWRTGVLAMGAAMNVDVKEYNVRTVRKHLIGRGNMKSEEAKAAVIARCKQLGWIVANDNEADAAAVWEYARAVLAKKFTPKADGLFDEGLRSG